MVLTLCNLRWWCFSSHRLAQTHNLHSWWSSPAICTGGVVSLLTSPFADVHKHMAYMSAHCNLHCVVMVVVVVCMYMPRTCVRMCVFSMPTSPFTDVSKHIMGDNLVEAHCYGIGRTGQIFEQSRSSEETDRNVDVSTAKVFVSTMLKKVESDWPNIYSNLVTL